MAIGAPPLRRISLDRKLTCFVSESDNSHVTTHSLDKKIARALALIMQAYLYV